VLNVIAQPKVLSNFATDLSGVELRADDLDWSFGSGTPVTGSAGDLALVLYAGSCRPDDFVAIASSA